MVVVLTLGLVGVGGLGGLTSECDDGNLAIQRSCPAELSQQELRKLENNVAIRIYLKVLVYLYLFQMFLAPISPRSTNDTSPARGNKTIATQNKIMRQDQPTGQPAAGISLNNVGLALEIPKIRLGVDMIF